MAGLPPVNEHPARVPVFPPCPDVIVPPKLHLQGGFVRAQSSFRGDHGSRAFVLRWNVTEASQVDIKWIDVYFYPETVGPGDDSLWRPLLRAKHVYFPRSVFIKLPSNHTYYLIARALDVNGRYGPYSDPFHIYFSEM